MIVGLGVELVDVPRFEAALERFGERLCRRLFTPGERSYAERRAHGAESLAVRFAAKLAARRALGDPGLTWRELEIVREPEAAPALRLHGAAARSNRPYCPECGYDLSKATSGNCPECGVKLPRDDSSE